ncbi:MAG: Na(+)/H(+) antiporter subunit D [Parvularculales bacterium]
MTEFNPALIYILGAALTLFIPKGSLRSLFMLSIPVIAAVHFWTITPDTYGVVPFMGQNLILMRVDALSQMFGLIFSLAAFLSIIFAWHVRDSVEHITTLLYAGATIGAVFAGDLITLFIFWEITAVASAFLVWARRTPGAYYTGLRYLVIQITSGVLLLAGAALYLRSTGSISFDRLDLAAPGALFIFFAFGIKCAFPLLHNWLQDAYPASTATGAVTLSSFTTKLAVYALARTFPGTEALIYIGAIMALFPIFYAVIENDLRRVLAYSLNNQLGFMVVGIGIGTPLALNGTAAHAFCHILYKSLLFMSMGAVLFRAGTTKGSELGGLYKSMPWTMVFCIIGAASISAFPLFSGFIAKSLILSATADNHYVWVWFVLLFASAGALMKVGIKIPYVAFFAHDSGIRCKEAPWNMLLAMGLTAALCIAIGVFPDPLYALLPYPVDYHPYTTDHVIAQMQLLLFSALAFGVLMKMGLYPPELRSVNLDSDWLYRRLIPGFIRRVRYGQTSASLAGITQRVTKRVETLNQTIYHSILGSNGSFARTWRPGFMVLIIALLLTATLALNAL